MQLSSFARFVLTVACVASFVQVSHAQSPPPDGFNPAADKSVECFAIQPDQKILVGGSFRQLCGQARTNIARLNADGSIDGDFNAGANNYVNCLVVGTDGRILVGGNFTTLDGVAHSYLGRLNADGSVDSTFNASASDVVRALVVQADGKILLGGRFTNLGGYGVSYLGRLNADGSVDSSFHPNLNGPVPAVLSIAVQPDGKILAGGQFTNGPGGGGILRFNPDGSVDPTFNSGAGGINLPEVTSVTVQVDGKILVGGWFTTLSGQPCSYLGRLNPDGSLDTSFASASYGLVYSMVIQTDGKTLVGGEFSVLGGQARTNLGRLNSDGSVDLSFYTGTGNWPIRVSPTLFIYPYVHSLAVDADGKTLVGGWFVTLGGQARTNLARLNSTGPATNSLTFDESSVTWLRGGTSPEVWRTSFELSTNGTDWVALGAGVRIAGGWQCAGINVSRNTIIRARGFVAGGVGNGSGWFVETLAGNLPSFSTQPVSRTNNAGTVATFSVLAGGAPPLTCQWLKNGTRLQNGGNVSGADTSTLMVSNVLHADAGGYSIILSNVWGSVTSSVATLTVVDPFIKDQPVSQWAEAGQTVVFTVGTQGTAPLSYYWLKNGSNTVGSAASLTLTNVQAAAAGDYQVIVSNVFGSVTSVVAVLTVNMATLDSFNLGANSTVNTIAMQTDGKILVGGYFTSMGGQSHNGIARLNTDGSLDTNFTAGVDGHVISLAVQADGKILVSGSFSTLCGQAQAYIGRIYPDGNLDTNFIAGANDTVNCLAIQPDGRILVGGFFSALGGQACSRFGRLNPDGSLDTTFNPQVNNTVNCVAVRDDGKILVGGWFTALDGQACNRIGQLNPDGSLDNAFGSGADSSVFCVAVQGDGKILLGGFFTQLGGLTINDFGHLGRLNADGAPDAGFNPGANGEVVCMSVQSDGKILVAGGFSRLGGQTRNCIGRLDPDGGVDSSFSLGANASVACVALQPDGKILVGGSFSALGGQPRSGIGRMNNTTAVTESLTVDGSTVTWLRGGSGPEALNARFDVFTSRSGWLDLGAGQRIAGGWQLAGTPLPPDATLRARAFVTGGFCNGSGWLVETIIGPPPLALQINCSGNSPLLGVWGELGRQYRIEFSSALTPDSAWQPLSTFWLTHNPQMIPDSSTGGAPQRFYRVRSNP